MREADGTDVPSTPQPGDGCPMGSAPGPLFLPMIQSRPVFGSSGDDFFGVTYERKSSTSCTDVASDSDSDSSPDGPATRTIDGGLRVGLGPLLGMARTTGAGVHALVEGGVGPRHQPYTPTTRQATHAMTMKTNRNIALLQSPPPLTYAMVMGPITTRTRKAPTASMLKRFRKK